MRALTRIKSGHDGDRCASGFLLAMRRQALLRIADYRADRFARDTTGVWLQLEWASSK